MSKTFKEIIDGVKKLIEENSYERSAIRREAYVELPLNTVIDNFDNYYITIYGKDLDHDECDYWLRYKDDKMVIGKAILIVNGGNMDNHDMADIFIKGILAHKKKKCLEE